MPGINADPIGPRKAEANRGTEPAAGHALQSHWERIYTTKQPTEVSWYQEHSALSVKMIREAGAQLSASIIDVGGGASILVDDLLDAGYRDITVLDLSTAALAAAKTRLGARGANVTWLHADILKAELPRHAYDVWHDRAVFHFLTAQEDRHAYVRAVLHAVRPGGIVIVATFADDGPTQCSGLPVMRYDAAGLHAQFGEPFELLAHEREAHHTPSGSDQKFVYCLCRKASS